MTTLQEAVWSGSLPLSIRLSPSECRTYDQADPYLIHHPRLSYLPFLLPRLHSFFSPSLIDPSTPPHTGWFSFESVPLKWHYPLGLLYDLFSGASPAQAPTPDRPSSTSFVDENREHLPWNLVLHFTDWPDEQLVRLDAEGKVLHDAFINSVKEADFLRNGTARGIMSLSKDDSTQLWRAVEEQNQTLYTPILQKLLPPHAPPLRHLPLKIYLPTPPNSTSPTTANPSPNHLRILQFLLPPSQTLGTALHFLLPALFPSRRIPILARPVLHGAVVPLGAGLEELVLGAAYLDGWVHLGVVMMG
ncbi:autophagy protein 5 [Toensbergia leucococca]|nr:autophagy protein 5 [Toensbergia leucococca]